MRRSAFFMSFQTKSRHTHSQTSMAQVSPPDTWGKYLLFCKLQFCLGSERRPAFVPVGLVLVNLSGLHDFGIVERAADELKAHGQAMITEATRHTDGGKPAKVSNA